MTSDIAVIIPCYNEEPTIAQVVDDFRSVLPQATIYVFDNNSTDASAELAEEAGAIVLHEKREGKGYVVKAMLEQVVADYYLMVDGDDTYPPEFAPHLLEPLFQGEADVVVGNRLKSFSQGSFRQFHTFGNNLVSLLVSQIFNASVRDVMSGYRAFTREVALQLPVIATGFDIETETTIMLLYRRFVIKEIDIPYRERPSGSFSKLNTASDGLLVLLKIFFLMVAYKPLTVFGLMSIFSLVCGLGVLFATASQTIQNPGSQLLVMVLSAILLISSLLFFSVGLTLTIVNWRIYELEVSITKMLKHVKSE